MAHWFLPIVGVIYSAGFLIVLIHSKNFGFDGAELIQGKYIHVGSLFLMATIVIGMPAYWCLQLCAAAASTDRISWRATFPGVVIYSTMLFTIYVVVAFTDRGFFHRNPVLVLSNFVVPVTYSLLRVLLGLAFKATTEATLSTAIGFIGAAVQLQRAHATLISDHLWTKLVTIFPIAPPSGVYGFAALTVLNVLYLSIATARLRQTAGVGARLRIILSTAALTGVLFYTSVLAFAYSVYPFIPSAKGGGSYLDSIPVEIAIDPKYEKALPSDVKRAISRKGTSFVIIYRTSDALFIAAKAEVGSPGKSQEPSARKPRVYELRREMVTGITYLNQ
jgi:hypothetical protein